MLHSEGHTSMSSNNLRSLKTTDLEKKITNFSTSYQYQANSMWQWQITYLTLPIKFLGTVHENPKSNFSLKETFNFLP